ncbi:MAG TPA: hypothetical protein VKR05_07555 [Candidatus Cybelea sp.]|nr:hypothetical protein [Candidatus Cybelea sp.]
MRDTFLLLWVGFLIIGVVGSMVSSVRKQLGRAAQDGSQRVEAARPDRRAQWQPQPPQGAAPSTGAPQQPVRVRRIVTVPAGQAPQWLQQAAAQIGAQVPRPAPPAVTPKTPAPPKPPLSVSPPPHTDFPLPRAASTGGLARLFRHRSGIVQAVIAAEVLGKPRAFNDEYFGA